MPVGNISSIFQEIKLWTLSPGRELRKRAVEIVHLFPEACVIGAICKVSFSLNDRQQGIEDTPLRLAIRLQVGVTKIQPLAEITAPFFRREPFVIVLAKVRIAAITLDSHISFETSLYQIQNRVLHGTRAKYAQWMNQIEQGGIHEALRGRFKGQRIFEALTALGNQSAQVVGVDLAEGRKVTNCSCTGTGQIAEQFLESGDHRTDTGIVHFSAFFPGAAVRIPPILNGLEIGWKGAVDFGVI